MTPRHKAFPGLTCGPVMDGVILNKKMGTGVLLGQCFEVGHPGYLVLS